MDSVLVFQPNQKSSQETIQYSYYSASWWLGINRDSSTEFREGKKPDDV